MLKSLKVIVANVIIFGVLLELVSFVLIHFFEKAPYPYAYVKTYPFTVADMNPTFGVWHPSNTQTKSFGPCWRVNMNFNNVGARDIDRGLNSTKKRFLLIGDSFFEGYGVQENERFQNRLETRTGNEFMSFGTSGIFGLTQMSLLYDTLASKYDHDYLIISFFPKNDFDDDDWNIAKNLDQYNKRYRPYYLKDSSGSYQLEYHVDKLEDSEWYYKNIQLNQSLLSQLRETITFKTDIKTKLNSIHKSYFFSRALLRHIVRTNALKNSQNFQTLESKVFQEVDESQFDRFKYLMNRIQAKAKGKKLILLTIAHPLDYISYEQNGNNLLGEKLDQFCSQNNIHHIDLLESLKDYPNKAELSLPCDGHWSSKGNEVVSDILYDEIKKFGYLD
ncbi:hypothetical protein SAMN06298216_2413 [Spirosomataceae bacterium TFI 002]|nr:hypothetical protein SAMN06298216_2413 [Spirosomataceae bacterium TFI 002]